jgi:hypothetical protein
MISIIISFFVVLSLFNNQKYKLSNKSIIEKISKENYLKDYPQATIFSLERQIRIVTNMLINLKESNRYIDKLLKKVRNNNSIKELKYQKKIEPDNIKIIDYKNKKLKAKVEFKNQSITYYFILKMKTVYLGRVFLKSFKIEKI